MSANQEMIRKEDGQWVLRSHDGSKVLGRHPSRAAALKQERRVQAFKHMGKTADLQIYDVTPTNEDDQLAILDVEPDAESGPLEPGEIVQVADTDEPDEEEFDPDDLEVIDPEDL